jgi:hypothetical protein
MVIAQHLQPLRSRLFLHPQLIERINQEAVALRLSFGVVHGEEFLCLVRIVPQVFERHDVPDMFQFAFDLPQKYATTLAGIVPGAVLTDRLPLRLVDPQYHRMPSRLRKNP